MIPEIIIRVGPLSVECEALSVQIHHGRDDATTQPVASTAVIELVGALPDSAAIGTRVSVWVVLGGIEYPRFVGEVTDLRMGWESADLAQPQIIATGDMGRMARRLVGAEPWPAELDGARVARIFDLAGFPADPLRTDVGTIGVLGKDVDSKPALELLHDTASDGGGVLWQTVAGDVLYADAAHRRSARLAYTFDACDVGVGLGWQQSLEGLVNNLHLLYGPVPEGGEQAVVQVADADSIAMRGRFGVSLSTEIATFVDAERRAMELVARQSQPSWVLGGLEVELSFLPEADWYSLLAALDVHDLIAITGLPPEGPSEDVLLWVEGWRESIEGDSWKVAFATSDYCRTAAASHWDDVAQSVTWDSVDSGIRWDDAVCFPPTVGGGLWSDVPPAERWDTLDPLIKWDSWGSGAA